VLAKGLSPARIVASYLHCTYNDLKSSDAWPYLVFLINFDDSELAAVEHSLTYFGSSNIPVTHLKGEVAKRSDMYLKGGVFSISYKQLVLDLLCKKLSPLIMTGIFLNRAHLCHRETDCETFLIKLVKRENAKTWVKCLSDAAADVARDGQLQ
jgi:DNA excision repair protein ERCC-4